VYSASSITARNEAWDRTVSLFVFSSSGILLLAGATNVLDVLARSHQPPSLDPLVGLPSHWLALFVAAAEVLVACVFLFTSKRTLALGLLAWLVANLVVYRMGLWWHGSPHPYEWVAPLTNTLNISPRWADCLVAVLAAYLFTGSISIVYLQRRMVLGTQAIKAFCPACGGHVKFKIRDLDRQVSCPHCSVPMTLRRPDAALKMACYFCKGHIEFPAHALGNKMPCPHCQRGITLKELAPA
jgi:hypothetical protein